MFILTVGDNYKQGDGETFSGVSKRHCLRQLKQHIEKLENVQIDLIIEQGYKDTRRLIYENNEFNIEVNVNGAGEIETFKKDREKAVERFLNICEEKGDHWDFEQTESLFIEGVREDEIVMQRSPDSHEQTQEAAIRVINALDNCGYNRKQVHAIAKWVQYLSTQA